MVALSPKKSLNSLSLPKLTLFRLFVRCTRSMTFLFAQLGDAVLLHNLILNLQRWKSVDAAINASRRLIPVRAWWLKRVKLMVEAVGDCSAGAPDDRDMAARSLLKAGPSSSGVLCM